MRSTHERTLCRLLPVPETVHPEAHLEVLRMLEHHPDYSQRELSVALGLSLGKTHYVLKALLNKGMLKARNFRRSDHKLGYLYILTPQGVKHRALLTRAFLEQKEAQFEALKLQIEALRQEAHLLANDVESTRE